MTTDPTTSPRLIAITIGGLGDSQFSTIGHMLDTIPGVKWCPLTGTDQFKDSQREVWKYIEQYPDAAIIFLGHSMGANTAANEANVAIASGKHVVGLVVIERVQYFDSNNRTTCGNVLDIRAATKPPADFIITDTYFAMAGGWVKVEPQTIPGTDHNKVCHAGLTLEMIENFVKDEL